MTALLKYLAFIAIARAQDLVPILVDESLIDRPEDGIDFPGCYSDLARADFNGDGVIKQNEYLSFINEYGKRICFSTDQLTLQQSATFNYLACICSSVEGVTDDCCIGSNAQILTAGATSTSASRTPDQEGYLTTVCKLTDATIAGSCRPDASSDRSFDYDLVKLLFDLMLAETLDDSHIDYAGCYTDLRRADVNGDGGVDQSEYVGFFNAYSKRLCSPATETVDPNVFHYLACLVCQSQVGALENCCTGGNAQIAIAKTTGWAALATTRSGDGGGTHDDYLVKVCKLTDLHVFQRNCEPAKSGSGDSHESVLVLHAAVVLAFLFGY